MFRIGKYDIKQIFERQKEREDDVLWTEPHDPLAFYQICSLLSHHFLHLSTCYLFRKWHHQRYLVKSTESMNVQNTTLNLISWLSWETTGAE